MSARAGVLALLVACVPGDGGETAATSAEAPACGTWATVGEPFTLTWCAGCHSSALPEARRYGAPVGLDLDTLEAVRRQQAAFTVVALGDEPRMPPAGGVPAAERAAMAAWLACGAPGEATRDAASPAESGLVDAGELLGEYVQAPLGAFTLALEAGDGLAALQLDFAGDADGDLDLVGWVVSDQGTPLGVGAYEPGVPVWPPSRAGETVDVDVSWPDGATTGAATWTLTADDEADPDPRFGDLDTLRLTVADEDGTRLTFWLSTTGGLVAADLAWGPASAFRVDRLLMLSSAPPREPSDGFPLRDGDRFIVRRTTLVEAP